MEPIIFFVETKENELTEEALNELSHNKGDENS